MSLGLGLGLGLSVGLTTLARFVQSLFAGGDRVGWAHWYDSPSLYPGGNHLYLYQDSAGTTPVTAVGQSVGLVLDRAYGGDAKR